jgi:hypothetical protein
LVGSDPGGAGGAGGIGQGGGLFLGGPTTVNLDNSTVAFNRAESGLAGPGGGGNPAGLPGTTPPSQGGGVRNDGGTLNAISTIIGDNTTIGAASTEIEFSGDFTTATHVLLTNNTGANLVAANPDANGNLVGTAAAPIDPGLLPLADNGGPTMTIALRSDSPALNSGSNPAGLTTDQRGLTIAGAIDIGSFQAGVTQPTPPATPPVGSLPPATPPVGSLPPVAPPVGSLPPTTPPVGSLPPSTPPVGSPPPATPPVVQGLVQEGITLRVVNVRGRRQLRVYDAVTGAQKFVFYPFGKTFVGNFQVETRDVNGDGVADIVVRVRRRGKSLTKVFSGVDGALLPGVLV